MSRRDSYRNLNLPVSFHKPSSVDTDVMTFLNSYFRYHIYKQNQTRLNNNNSTRVNLNNVNRPAPVVVQPAPGVQPAAENAENAERNETDGPEQQADNEADPLVATPEPTVPEEPQVPILTIVRTFVLSFFSSIIPEAPAL